MTLSISASIWLHSPQIPDASNNLQAFNQPGSGFCILDWLPNRSQNSYSRSIPSIIHAISIICRQASLSAVATKWWQVARSRGRSICICIEPSEHRSFVASQHRVRKRFAKSVINVRIFCCRIIANATVRQKLPVQIERIIARHNCKHSRFLRRKRRGLSQIKAGSRIGI